MTYGNNLIGVAEQKNFSLTALFCYVHLKQRLTSLLFLSQGRSENDLFNYQFSPTEEDIADEL